MYRVLPSTPVAVRQGAVILAADGEQDAELDAAVRELLEELGTLVVLDDALVDVAMGLMSNAPAYYALVVEAQVDAGVRHGLTADQASRAGRADDGRHGRAAAPPTGYDTLAVRRAVTSPGGSTARGLDALERGGVRAAFSDALDAILKPMTRRARHLRGRISRTTCTRSSCVYTLLIIAYILSSLYFAFGGRLPYSRWSSAMLGFLRDVCEPYLAIFRRFIPPIGPLDLSPIIGDPRCCSSSAAWSYRIIAG